MSILNSVIYALDQVKKAREECPFSETYRGRKIHAVHEACSKCGARSNGDGGRCVVDHAEHAAIKTIEEAVA